MLIVEQGNLGREDGLPRGILLESRDFKHAINEAKQILIGKIDQDPLVNENEYYYDSSFNDSQYPEYRATRAAIIEVSSMAVMPIEEWYAEANVTINQLNQQERGNIGG
jgi:negative regulator of genetic competence, sporulation and motility